VGGTAYRRPHCYRQEHLGGRRGMPPPVSTLRLVEKDEAPRSSSAPSTRAGPALGSREAFERAIRPILPQIYRVCLALCRDTDEADDLLQNSLVKAYCRVDSFEGRGDLLAWICGIVRHEHLENRRTFFRRFSLLESIVDGCSSLLGSLFAGGSDQPTPEEHAISSERWETLLESLRDLPEEFRMVVLLCDVEELGYDRVAEILEIPVGTVKSRHARGRARLKAAFQERERQSTLHHLEERP